MQLLYNPDDAAYLQKRRTKTISWLVDLGAIGLDDAGPDTEGFLFAYARKIEEYAALIAPFPLLRDRAEDRAPLLSLGDILQRLAHAQVAVPMPKTWCIGLDEPLPKDIAFPLFLRTQERSWKVGGHASRVCNPREFDDESAMLRRAFGWDAPIFAREWLNFAPAGRSVYGEIPQEIRTWSVDGTAVAWSFHHLHVVKAPKGFPPSEKDLADLQRMATAVAKAFGSRLVVADFAKLKSGSWIFIEAGPGSMAGTGHEKVFKAVALTLTGSKPSPMRDDVGGVFA